MEKRNLLYAECPLFPRIFADLFVFFALSFVLLGNLVVNMEVRGVLQGDRVVQHDGKEYHEDEQPMGLDSVLVGAHEVATEVLRLQVEQG